MRGSWKLALAAVPALGLVALVMGAGNFPSSRSEPGNQSLVVRGLHIAPVPLDLRHKNRELVGLGSYLVNAVGGCNDCHTCPSYAPGVEHNPYAGGDGQINADNYLAGGLDFQLGPGVVVTSANLTPDDHGRPEGHTFDEFKAILRTGHDPDENRTLQVMPWPVYRNMTEGDMRAIYEYLRALPSRPTPPPGSCQFAGQATFPD